MDIDPLWRAWAHFSIGGGVLFLAGLVILAVVRRKDEKNWIVQRAPAMPIRLVNVRDDVWVHGETRCESPLRIPHFGIKALSYTYLLEERVMRTRIVRDSKGRMRTETYYAWETRRNEGEQVDFAVVDGEAAVNVRIAEARIDGYSQTGYSYDGASWRHSASYFPYPSLVHAVGSISEKKEFLEPYANIPLIVTIRSREEYLKSIERSEKVWRFVGSFLLLLSLFLLLCGASFGWDFPSWGVEMRPWRFALGGGGALLLFFCFWSLQLYNRLVSYRQRVRNAWGNVDVDLKNRHDLIPNLVDVIKGTVQLERDVMEGVARLRSGADGKGMHAQVESANGSSAVARQLIAVIERYPNLKSVESFMHLHRQLVALEDKIAHGRSCFNDTVREYNTLVDSFPHSLVAEMFHVRRIPHLVDGAMQEPPAPSA